ncbi:hypothetical protein [Sinobacterium norvegicum]|nr:hypothetical protein [Sinobacterium norvegicum]
MFLFSASAKVKKAQDGYHVGDDVEFIAYIDFKDQLGAVQLCKFYMANAGFGTVVIDKMKEANADFIKNSVNSTHRGRIEEAQKQGYSIQLFEK